MRLAAYAAQLPSGWDHCTSGYRCRSGVPLQVKGALEGVPIAAISAGRYWTLAAARDGRLFTWGMDGCATGAGLPALPRPCCLMLVERRVREAQGMCSIALRCA